MKTKLQSAQNKFDKNCIITSELQATTEKISTTHQLNL